MSQRLHRLPDWRRSVTRMMLDGRVSPAGPLRFEADHAGSGRYRCTAPVAREYSSAIGYQSDQGRVRGPSHVVTFHVRCRTCEPCRKARAVHWRARGIEEARRSAAAFGRTWFGTMTLSPERRFLLLSEARARYADFDGWSPDRRCNTLADIAYTEVQRYLKRVRKESGATIKFMVVAEKHQDHTPHFHILVHEVDDKNTVGERTLRKQWTWGHSKFNVAKDEKAVFYATKYIAKDAITRVRASKGYGQIACDERSKHSSTNIQVERGITDPKTKGILTDVISDSVSAQCGAGVGGGSAAEVGLSNAFAGSTTTAKRAANRAAACGSEPEHGPAGVGPVVERDATGRTTAVFASAVWRFWGSCPLPDAAGSGEIAPPACREFSEWEGGG